jgi:hypothetical protein
MRPARAVPPPLLCRKTTISRMIFCSAQGIRDALGAEGANVGDLAQAFLLLGGALLALQEGFDVENLFAKAWTIFFA